MGKEYTIFINSDNGIDDNGAKSLIKYSFDWSILEQGEYEMSFTFLSGVEKTELAVGEKLFTGMVVDVIVPFSSNRYEVSAAPNSYAGSTNAIGFIKLESVDRWHASHHPHFSMRQWVSQVDNPTIKLSGAPSGNDFSIKIRAATGGVPSTTPTTYNMILKLKHIC